MAQPAPRPPWSPSRPYSQHVLDATIHSELIGAVHNHTRPHDPSTSAAAAVMALPPIVAKRGSDGMRVYETCGRSFLSRLNADGFRKQVALLQEETARRQAAAARVSAAIARASSASPVRATRAGAGGSSAAVVAPPPLSPYRALMGVTRPSGAGEAAAAAPVNPRASLAKELEAASQAGPGGGGGGGPLLVSPRGGRGRGTTTTGATSKAVDDRFSALERRLAAVLEDSTLLRLRLERADADVRDLRVGLAASQSECDRLRAEASTQAVLVASLRDELAAAAKRAGTGAAGSSSGGAVAPASSSSSVPLEAVAAAEELRSIVQERDAAIAQARERELALRHEVASMTMRMAAMSGMSALRMGTSGLRGTVSPMAAGGASSRRPSAVPSQGATGAAAAVALATPAEVAASSQETVAAAPATGDGKAAAAAAATAAPATAADSPSKALARGRSPVAKGRWAALATLRETGTLKQFADEGAAASTDAVPAVGAAASPTASSSDDSPLSPVAADKPPGLFALAAAASAMRSPAGPMSPTGGPPRTPMLALLASAAMKSSSSKGVGMGGGLLGLGPLSPTPRPPAPAASSSTAGDVEPVSVV